MKYFRTNHRSIISKLLLFIMFAVLGCTQKNCSCKRLEPFKQDIIITDGLGQKPTDKFPAELVELLYLKYADTLSPGYAPGGNLYRLDMDVPPMEDFQKTGLGFAQRSLRSIFPLGVDHFNSGIDSLFLKNEIGKPLSTPSAKPDSIKISLINKDILDKLNSNKKYKFYFYNKDTNVVAYCCKLVLTDTLKAKATAGAGLTKPAAKKPRKGMGCSDNNASKTAKEKLTRIDTVFLVHHNLIKLNEQIAHDADSVNKSQSGCSTKNKNVTFVIFYNPPVSNCQGPVTSIKITNSLGENKICIHQKLKITATLGRFKTNVEPSNIIWEIMDISPGLTVTPMNGSGDSAVVQISRKTTKITGDFIVKVTPMKDTLKSESSGFKYQVVGCDSITPVTTKTSFNFKLSNNKTLITFDKTAAMPTVPITLSSLGNAVDSLVWSYSSASDGLTIDLPEKSRHGKNVIPVFHITKTAATSKGTITFKVTPYKANNVATPAFENYIFEIKQLPAQAIPAFKFKLSNNKTLITFDKTAAMPTVPVTLSSSGNAVDSLVWTYIAASDGLTVDLPQKARHGKNVIPAFQITKTAATTKGTITFKVTPYKANTVATPAFENYIFEIKQLPAHPIIPFNFKISNNKTLITFDKTSVMPTVPVTLTSSGNAVDSLVWAFVAASDGLTVDLPEKARHGKNVIPAFQITKTAATTRGTITFKVTPYKANSIANPAFDFYTFEIKQLPAAPPPVADTATTNKQRRKIIAEFRERLFFYFNAKPEDRDYFRQDAVKKINEIPKVRIEVYPQNSIDVIFNTNWQNSKITPIYDSQRMYIIGIKISL